MSELSGDIIRVLAEDPDLGQSLGQEDLAAATDAALARQQVLEPGHWDAFGEYGQRQGWLGLLVVEGYFLRTLRCAEETSSELIGPGDIARPWDHDSDYALESLITEWLVLRRTRLALLDDRFAERLVRWPAVLIAIIERVGVRARWLSVRVAITHLEGIATRVFYLMWHLAERWGRVTPVGIVIPVPLTHDQIAHLIGSRRPSVTMAVGQLDDRGLIRRGDEGTWIVPVDAQQRLDDMLRGG